jgi:hypothetical protein
MGFVNQVFRLYCELVFSLFRYTDNRNTYLWLFIKVGCCNLSYTLKQK